MSRLGSPTVPEQPVILHADLRLVPGLSHTIITSGAVASCGFGLAQRSPVDPDKPLMSFDIALTLVPAILFGVSFVSFWLPCNVKQPSHCIVPVTESLVSFRRIQVPWDTTHHSSIHAVSMANSMLTQ